jgi:dienelactone hydrolase
MMSVILTCTCLGEMPNPLISNDGRKVNNASDWEKRRLEILEIIRNECFGRNPVGKPTDLNFQVIEQDDNAIKGKAIRKAVLISFSGPGGKMSFRVNFYIPKSAKPTPAFLLMSHHSNDIDQETENPFWPVSLLISRGYAAIAFNGNQVDVDKHDEFKGGVHGIFDKEPRTDDAWGTIAAWSWACSRVMDYIETEKLIDSRKVAVVGHSRGGKTSLWASANDTRFAMAISNNSGCSGAAIARRKKGERIKDIIRFKHWFCKNYSKYADKEEILPFDSHMLIALTAPRLVYVASASEDAWADPEGEFEGTVMASEVYEKLGLPGLSSKTFPKVNEAIQGGKIAYHLREGKHNLIEFDWSKYMDFADLHFK